MNARIKQLGIRGIGLILVIAAILFAGASITGVAAQSSIPGDALYPVKTSMEQTRLTLAQDAGNRALMKMAFAEQRLEEITALIAEGRYREVGKAVLAFEADINSAILELETLSEIDPARAARIAREITVALTRYAQTLSAIVASAPDSIKPEVTRALDSTHIASTLELPDDRLSSGDDGNINDDSGNTNDDRDGDDNGNANTNDDSGNGNINDDSGDDANSNDDSGNANTNDDSGNANDDSGNANTNDDSGSVNANSNTNTNDDSGNANANSNDDNSNTNDNTNDDSGSGGKSNDDNSNTNTNDDSGSGSDSNDDNGNTNTNDDNSNANANDDSGKGKNENGDD